MSEYRESLDRLQDNNINDLEDREEIIYTSEIEIDLNISLYLSFNSSDGVVRAKCTFQTPEGKETILASHTAMFQLNNWMQNNEGFYISEHFRVETIGGLRTVQEIQLNVSPDHALMLLDVIS